MLVLTYKNCIWYYASLIVSLVLLNNIFSNPSTLFYTGHLFCCLILLNTIPSLPFCFDICPMQIILQQILNCMILYVALCEYFWSMYPTIILLMYGMHLQQYVIMNIYFQQCTFLSVYKNTTKTK